MILHPHLTEEDMYTNLDIRTMREVVKMGNSITNMVQLIGDCPSLNQSGMMPLLDLQCWVEGNQLLYQHYRKPMTNPLLMMELSAMPAEMKRTALTQEVVRIRKNCHPGLPWATQVKRLNNFSDRMSRSGYSEMYRFQVIKSGIEGLDQMLEVEKFGGRPINRSRLWEEDLRQQKKDSLKRNWFRKGGYHVPLFVPHTPGGELVKRMKAKEAENNQGRKLRFMIP